VVNNNAVKFQLSGTHGTGKVSDYQTVPIMTQVLTGNFWLLPSEDVCLSVIFTAP